MRTIAFPRTLVLLVGFFAAAVSPAPAESNNPASPPAGVLLKDLPDFTQWQIVFTYADEAGNAAPVAPAKGTPVTPRPKTLLVTITAPQWHSQLTNSDGSTQDMWFDGQMAYLVDSSVSGPSMIAADALQRGAAPRFLDFVGKKFPDFNWVSLKTYKSTQPISGRPCLFFQEPSDKGAIAWIDAETRLPVRWRQGTETRDFSPLTKPTSNLTMPPDVEPLSEEVKMAHKHLTITVPART